MHKLIRTITAHGNTAEIVQHGQHVYSLTITSRKTGHNRWGTLHEIEADAEHFAQTGSLPRSTSARPW